MRWLDRASEVASRLRRRVTPEETRGPFQAYRWEVVVESEHGVRKNVPVYGVVSVRQVMYRVHMVRGLYDAGLFRLNTDVWLEYL